MSILVPQLDGSPHAGDNCGPASVAEALRWATDHDVAPSPSAVRARMGDFVGGTTMDEHAPAFGSYEQQAHAEGWRLEPMRYAGSAPFADLMRALEAGKGATLAIDYSRVPKPLKCSRSFDGAHAVFCSAVRTIGGRKMVKVWDPLADGRRADVPRGPLWYPVATLRLCAEGLTRKNHALYNVVRHAIWVGGPNSIHGGADAEPHDGVLLKPRP